MRDIVLIKPSVTLPISQTTYNLNNEILVCYSSFDLNIKPYNDLTGLDHSNTELVYYSDPLCIFIVNNFFTNFQVPSKRGNARLELPEHQRLRANTGNRLLQIPSP